MGLPRTSRALALHLLTMVRRQDLGLQRRRHAGATQLLPHWRLSWAGPRCADRPALAPTRVAELPPWSKVLPRATLASKRVRRTSTRASSVHNCAALRPREARPTRRNRRLRRSPSNRRVSGGAAAVVQGTVLQPQTIRPASVTMPKSVRASAAVAEAPQEMARTSVMALALLRDGVRRHPAAHWQYPTLG